MIRCLRARLDQKGIVGNIGDHRGSDASQLRPEGRSDRSLGLNQPGFDGHRGAQGSGNSQRFATGGVHQGIPKQERRVPAHQLPERGIGVAQPVGDFGIPKPWYGPGRKRDQRNPLRGHLRRRIHWRRSGYQQWLEGSCWKRDGSTAIIRNSIPQPALVGSPRQKGTDQREDDEGQLIATGKTHGRRGNGAGKWSKITITDWREPRAGPR